MRGYKKFLFRNTWHVFSCFFKKRILNFKRTKWKKIKSRIFYTNKQYILYKKKLINSKFLKFFKNIRFLKKKIKLKRLKLNKKFLCFFKRLKFFLISKKYKKVKRNLKYKLDYYKIKKNLNLRKFNYFKKCFNLFFLNHKTFKFSHKYHLRNRFFFKNRLFMKISILKYYYGCFNVKYFRREPMREHHKTNIAITFLKPELRLDIILWRLKFFASPYLARFAFQTNKIFLNMLTAKNFTKHYYKNSLKKGDLISFISSLKYRYRNNLKTYAKNLYLPTIFEFDYYTNNVLLLKNLLELNYKDFNSVLKEPLALYQFKNYIFK